MKKGSTRTFLYLWYVLNVLDLREFHQVEALTRFVSRMGWMR